MEKYILAIDQGTTSTRALLYNQQGEATFKAMREVKCLFPKSGYVESNAIEIWISVVDVINEVLIKANIDFTQIDSIALTNQRETTVMWEKDSGKPVYNAIVWQSRQSADICARYEDKKEYIQAKTGLLINPYFSASKIIYIFENVPSVKERAKRGEILFGTIDSWILYRLSNGKVHNTDITNASRTLLYNIYEHRWDDDLLKLFDIPRAILPEVKPSSYDYGVASYFNDYTHIHALAGDQHAALFGQHCFNKGDFKNTYGTGCFMLLNTGKTPITSQNGLLTTIAWQIGDEITYALEGSVFVGGAAVQWLRDGLKIIRHAYESESLALEVNDSEGVVVVPSFVGLGTPYWDDDVKGAIFGLTRATKKAHIARATLEAIAFESKDVIEVMKKDAGIDIKELRVDGGATANDVLMQFQSDILGAKILKPTSLETTSLGASYLAGLSSHFYRDIKEIVSLNKIAKTYTPKMSKEEIKRRYDLWLLAIKATQTFK